MAWYPSARPSVSAPSCFSAEPKRSRDGYPILEQSRPRSPILADAFKRAGLVERKGKGVNEMFEQQLRAGRDAPSYVRSTTSSVPVSVPLGTADLDLVRFLLTFENEQQRSQGLEQVRMVHEIKQMGSAALSELTETLSLLPVRP